MVTYRTLLCIAPLVLVPLALLAVVAGRRRARPDPPAGAPDNVGPSAAPAADQRQASTGGSVIARHTDEHGHYHWYPAWREHCTHEEIARIFPHAKNLDQLREQYENK